MCFAGLGPPASDANCVPRRRLMAANARARGYGLYFGDRVEPPTRASFVS